MTNDESQMPEEIQNPHFGTLISQLPTAVSDPRTLLPLLRVFAVLYALAIVVVTLLPSGSDTPWVGGWDAHVAPGVQNAMHLPAYGLLVVLLMAAFGRAARRPWLALGLITAGCVAFGVTSEWLQASVIPGRFGSVTDAVSNTLGCLLGVAVVVGWKKVRAPGH